VTLNQLLGASGTATLASATITGDLTVDTSTLKVDSANNRVGIGTATPARPLDIVGSFQSTLGWVLTGTPAGLGAATRYIGGASTTDSWYYNAVSGGSHVWAFGESESMRLNSTGLGVGVSPSYNLDVRAAAATANVQSSTGTNAVSIVARNTGGSFTLGKENSVGGGSGVFGQDAYASVLWSTGAYPIALGTNGAQRMLIDATGNVGIGVTPSAWATLRGLQNGRANLVGYVSNAEGAWLSNNAFYDGSWKYQVSSQASHYQQLSGAHSWHIAASGTAGNAITFTQAMTLDASGNLLVGKTASSSTVVGAELRPSGAIISTLAASTNADFALYTYSTGAGAARFYVGMSGTVFATNTTISAISDARLKENVQDIDVGLGAILALKPRKFDWKEGKGKNIKGDRGFIAQEVEQVFPQLVDEWADPAPEGEVPYKSVRQDLIPVLVKAIQELAAEVNALKNA